VAKKNIPIGITKLLLKEFGLTDEETEKLADYRLEICKPCSKNLSGVCRGCGCVLEAKTRVKDETCPDNKW